MCALGTLNNNGRCTWRPLSTARTSLHKEGTTREGKQLLLYNGRAATREAAAQWNGLSFSSSTRCMVRAPRLHAFLLDKDDTQLAVTTQEIPFMAAPGSEGGV